MEAYYLVARSNEEAARGGEQTAGDSEDELALVVDADVLLAVEGDG